MLRVARPTDRLEDVVQFYTQGLGLIVLGSFQDHEGFDGLMLGAPGATYHLEFTRKRDHTVGGAPTQDPLLVFYLPDPEQWQAAVDRMRAAGYEPVASYNPYWDNSGRTFEDPDGYRVVLQNASWP
jgi:catechol 2,3-dioxygenase-like lactoylglutathione lyase family enzyme